MTIEKRIKTIQLINKIDRNPKFSKRIGTVNKSYFEADENICGIVNIFEKSIKA